MFNKCKRGRREERETVKLAEENRTRWKSGDVIICPCTQLLHYNHSSSFLCYLPTSETQPYRSPCQH